MRLAFGLCCSILPMLAQAAELRDVRVWAGPEGTRVVFDLDSAAQHSLFSLSNPERLVIDLNNTRRARDISAPLEGKGVVQQLRSAAHTDGSLRVVLDLSGPAKSKSFTLEPNESYGFRVVVDLFGDAPSLPATAAPAPRTGYTEKPIVIAIDAGHGGEDPGAPGRNGMWEKDVALSLARRLAAKVGQERGFKAVLIRDGDYYVGHRQRIEKAQAAQADLFVSIHANSFKDRNVRGSAVYVLSPKGASSEHAKLLAQRENMSDLIGGVDLQARDDVTAAVLIDIAQTSAIEASHDLGDRLLSAISRVNVLQRPRVQQAGFAVLKAPDIPSVLIETAFLTNEREARLLSDPAYQDNMARSMLEGIKGYFENYRPLHQYAQSSEPPSGASGGFQPVSFGSASAAR